MKYVYLVAGTRPGTNGAITHRKANALKFCQYKWLDKGLHVWRMSYELHRDLAHTIDAATFQQYGERAH